MPANFPEIWLKRVKRNISEAISAPWLDGIPELDVPVIELGEGDISEKNTIHIPTTIFKPDVLINNTTYPIALQAYTDAELTVNLDKYQTKGTTVSDDQIVGSSYDKIDVVTKSHTEAIAEKKYAKAIHAIAPASNGVTTPIIVTTGADDGTGRKRMVYADLVTLRRKCKGRGWRLVLCNDHYNDLLLDRDRFGDLLVNYREGGVAPVISGFKTYEYEENPYYIGSTKSAFGSVPGPTSYQASVLFNEGDIAKKTGLTKQYFSPAKTDTETQTNKLNYRHYFIAVAMGLKNRGAIVSGTV